MKSIGSGLLLAVALLITAASVSSATVVSKQLTAQSCNSENSSNSPGNLVQQCNGIYPSSCGAGGDLLSCRDGFAENHTIANNKFGGLNASQFNTSVADCLSIVDVSMCYVWWATASATNCAISVSNNSGSSYSIVTNSCPGTSPNPAMVCANVTSNATWSCSNFFGPTGSRAKIKSELQKSSGGNANALWDLLIFNVTYLVPTPVSACSVISTPGFYSLSSNLSGAPNPGSPTSINACIHITSSNVSLDCGGFSITNNGTNGSTAAILVENANNVTVKNCPVLTQYTDGIYSYAMSNSTVSNLTAFNNTYDGLSMVLGFNNTVTGLTVFNSTQGIDLTLSSNNTVSGNDIFNASNIGILVISASGNSLTANNVSNSSIGIELSNATNNDVNSNNADSDSTGYLLDSGSSGNRLNMNNASLSSYGFFLSNASGNNLTNNLANISATGFYLSLSSDNRLTGDNSTGATNDGFFLTSGSGNNTLANDNAVNGMNRGFRLQDGADGNVLTNVFAANNGDANYALFGSDGNSINGFVSGNGTIGVELQDSDDTLLSAGVVANSTTYGIQIVDSNNTVITAGRTYNNNPDLMAGDSLPAPALLSLSSIFDSPSGTMANYTNLSITDNVENGTAYSVNWSSSAPTLPLPPSYFSFGQKFLNITNLTGGVSIDSAVWHWQDNESGAGNQTAFQLWDFSSGSWSLVNNTPDTSANTLSLTNLNSFSVFAILFPLDTTPPNVTLSSPSNGSFISSSAVNLSFFTSDDMSTQMNCSLFLDGALNQTNPSVANNTPTAFGVSGLQMGNHTWKVTCKDNSSNVGTSPTWNFFVTAVSSCPVITVPGSYVQVVNLLGAPNTLSPPPQSGFSSVCVKIAASNTAFDCQGFNITNSGVNNAMGIYVNGSLTNVTIRNCGVSLYKQGGLVFQTVGSSVVNSSFFNNSQVGLFSDTSSNLTLLNDTAFLNGQDGIGVSGGGNNTITNNTLFNNKGSGIDLLGSPNNNFSGNNATNNTLEGIHVASSDNNLFYANSVLNNKQDGIQVVTNTNNTFINNRADLNAQHGIHISNTVTNLFINNTMDYNAQDGMLSASSTGSSFISNTACYNGQSGFLFASSTVDQMTNNTACSNAQSGIFIDDSNLTTLSGDHYFDNGLDFTMLSGSTKVVNTANEIFDNPLDSFQNYTNLSVNDTEVSSTFSISWSPSPAALPPGCPVFGNKFVNITNSSGNVSIDSITWHWLANETAGLDLGFFHLAVFNGSGWTAVNNQAANLTADSITVANLTQFGVIGILMCNDSDSALKLNQTVLPPSPGGIVQFNITINNTGNTTLDPLKVVDALPSGLTYSSASPLPSNVTGQAVTWYNVTALAPGASTVVYVNATVDAGAVNASTPLSNLTNNATATGNDPINLDVTASSAADVTIYYANVSISKADITPVPLSPGGIAQWLITVANPGQVTLEPAALTDTLPEGFGFLSSSVAPAAVSADNRTISWTDIGPIAPGGTALIYLNSSVAGSEANGTYTNEAVAVGVPPNGADVTATALAPIDVLTPGLKLEKDVVPLPNITIGQNVTYLINATNNGSVNITVSVTDSLPANVTFQGASVPPTSVAGGTVSWVNLTTLPPGGSFILLYNVSASANGTYRNNASGIGYPPDGDPAVDSDSDTFGAAAPSIDLDKYVNQTTNVSIGQAVLTTLHITNTGSVDLSVSVTDVLPAGVSFLGADTAPSSISGNVVSWRNVTTLPPAGTFFIHYNVSASTNGTFVDNASAIGISPFGANATDGESASFTVVPAQILQPPGGGGSHTMSLSYSFVCPGNLVVFNATESHAALDGVSINVIYDTPPAYGTVGTLTTGSNGTASTALSANGTYDVVASLSGYLPVHTGLSFTTCPLTPQCSNDSQCGSAQQCSGGSCKDIQCGCGQTARDHACVGTLWQCGGGPDCPSCSAGESCGADHACYQCTSDQDCKDTQYCDIAQGAKGGVCKDITACGLVANHTVVQTYECGLPSCPACPSGELCEAYACVSYNLTGPAQGLLGDNATLLALKNGLPCANCSLTVTFPGGDVENGRTDAYGRFILPLEREGTHNATLIEGGSMASVLIEAVPPAQPAPPPRPGLIDTYWPWLLLLLLLLLLALLYFLWRGRITVYSEPGAIGANAIAASQGLLDSKGIKSGDTVALQLGSYKCVAKVVPLPQALSLSESKARGEGSFILAGNGVLKALRITPGGQRDTGGSGFESFARVRGLKIKAAK